MGTRGVVGFRMGGVDKVTYNHWDSYPEGLGKKIIESIVKWREEIGWPKIRMLVSKIELVSDETEPTVKQIRRFRKYADTNVSTGKLTDWYVLLRQLQGDLNGYLQAGVMLDASPMLTDPGDCEYAYIVNLDTMMLEFYTSRKQAQAQTVKGRYALNNPNQWVLALEAEFGLRELMASPVTVKRMRELAEAS